MKKRKEPEYGNPAKLSLMEICDRFEDAGNLRNEVLEEVYEDMVKDDQVLEEMLNKLMEERGIGKLSALVILMEAGTAISEIAKWDKEREERRKADGATVVKGVRCPTCKRGTLTSYLYG